MVYAQRPRVPHIRAQQRDVVSVARVSKAAWIEWNGTPFLARLVEGIRRSADARLSHEKALIGPVIGRGRIDAHGKVAVQAEAHPDVTRLVGGG
jgi:hypothetical protein